MAFLIFKRAHVFMNAAGDSTNAGGTVEFFEDGTTTPANVYGDQALAVNLGSTLNIGLDGRISPSTQVWGNQSYRIRERDANGTLVAEDDPVSDPAGAATSIPPQTGHAGELLGTNGVNLQFVEYESKQLPDMNGNADKILTNDGEIPLWRAASDLGVPNVDDTDDSTYNYVLGNKRYMGGSGTLPVPVVSPPHGSSVTVTFPTAFSGAPICYGAWPNKITIASSGFRAVIASEATATQMVVDYNINENTTDPGANVAVEIPFSWEAVGPA